MRDTVGFGKAKKSDRLGSTCNNNELIQGNQTIFISWSELKHVQVLFKFEGRLSIHSERKKKNKKV
jgi:hypothetical protein